MKSERDASLSEYLAYREAAARNGDAYLNLRDWRKWIDAGKPVVTAELIEPASFVTAELIEPERDVLASLLRFTPNDDAQTQSLKRIAARYKAAFEAERQMHEETSAMFDNRIEEIAQLRAEVARLRTKLASVPIDVFDFLEAQP